MVEYLKYKDKQVPVRISYYALSEFKKETGSEFDDTSGSIDLAMFEPILFYSIESGCRATGEKMPFKREDMFDILEECFMEFASIMPKFFPEKKGEALIMGNRQQRRTTEKKQ